MQNINEGVKLTLVEAGLTRKFIESDGNCQFHAIAHQLNYKGLVSQKITYKDVRKAVARYISDHPNKRFSNYGHNNNGANSALSINNQIKVDNNYTSLKNFANAMENPNNLSDIRYWGNELSLRIACEIYNVQVRIFRPTGIMTRRAINKPSSRIIDLYFWGNIHYDSTCDKTINNVNCDDPDPKKRKTTNNLGSSSKKKKSTSLNVVSAAGPKEIYSLINTLPGQKYPTRLAKLPTTNTEVLVGTQKNRETNAKKSKSFFSPITQKRIQTLKNQEQKNKQNQAIKKAQQNKLLEQKKEKQWEKMIQKFKNSTSKFLLSSNPKPFPSKKTPSKKSSSNKSPSNQLPSKKSSSKKATIQTVIPTFKKTGASPSREYSNVGNLYKVQKMKINKRVMTLEQVEKIKNKLTSNQLKQYLRLQELAQERFDRMSKNINNIDVEYHLGLKMMSDHIINACLNRSNIINAKNRITYENLIYAMLYAYNFVKINKRLNNNIANQNSSVTNCKINFYNEAEMYHFMALLMVDIIHDTKNSKKNSKNNNDKKEKPEKFLISVLKEKNPKEQKRINTNNPVFVFWQFLNQTEWFDKDIFPKCVEKSGITGSYKKCQYCLRKMDPNRPWCQIQWGKKLHRCTCKLISRIFSSKLEHNAHKYTLSFLRNIWEESNSLKNKYKNTFYNGRSKKNDLRVGFGQFRNWPTRTNYNNSWSQLSSDKRSFVYDQCSKGKIHKMINFDKDEICVSLAILADKGLTQPSNETSTFFDEFVDFFTQLKNDDKIKNLISVAQIIQAAHKLGDLPKPFYDVLSEYVGNFILRMTGNEYNWNNQIKEYPHINKLPKFSKNIVKNFNINFSDQFISEIKFQNKHIFSTRYYYNNDDQEKPSNNIHAGFYDPNKSREMNKQIWKFKEVLSAGKASKQTNISDALFKTIGDLNLCCYAAASKGCVATGDISAATIHMYLSELNNINNYVSNSSRTNGSGTGITIHSKKPNSIFLEIPHLKFLYESSRLEAISSSVEFYQTLKVKDIANHCEETNNTSKNNNSKKFNQTNKNKHDKSKQLKKLPYTTKTIPNEQSQSQRFSMSFGSG